MHIGEHPVVEFRPSSGRGIAFYGFEDRRLRSDDERGAGVAGDSIRLVGPVEIPMREDVNALRNRSRRNRNGVAEQGRKRQFVQIPLKGPPPTAVANRKRPPGCEGLLADDFLIENSLAVYIQAEPLAVLRQRDVVPVAVRDHYISCRVLYFFPLFLTGLSVHAALTELWIGANCNVAIVSQNFPEVAPVYDGLDTWRAFRKVSPELDGVFGLRCLEVAG